MMLESLFVFVVSPSGCESWVLWWYPSATLGRHRLINRVLVCIVVVGGRTTAGTIIWTCG